MNIPTETTLQDEGIVVEKSTETKIHLILNDKKLYEFCETLITNEFFDDKKIIIKGVDDLYERLYSQENFHRVAISMEDSPLSTLIKLKYGKPG